MSKRSRALRYYRSYKPQSPATKVLRFLVKVALIVGVSYYLISMFIVRAYQVETTAARPLLESRDSLLATPLLYGPPLPLTDGEIPQIRAPHRGELVIRRNTQAVQGNIALRIADPVVRFFTLQRVSLLAERQPNLSPARSIMRVIGVPGDTLEMRGYKVYIKPEGGNSFIAERELIQREYELIIPSTADGAAKNVPLSGNHPSVTLGKGEYLLLPDNRSFASSSSTWQATAERQITEKVMVRYWPQFTNF